MRIKYTLELALTAFWSKVDKSGGENSCWIWIPSKSNDYGRAWWNEHHIRAHRLSYQLTFGEFDQKLNVLHTCDNPRCVNPKHLFLGTHKDNMMDMTRKGRHRDAKGEKHGRHKLTLDEVRKIRNLRKAENLTYKQIGSKFDISRQEVGHIIRGENWNIE